MSLRPFIFQNLWLKLFSLILAILIWLAIQSNQSDHQLLHLLFPAQTRELQCPITVMTTPVTRSVLRIEPGTVAVKVRAGDAAVLKNLRPESIQAYVRLPDLPNLSRLLRVEVIVPRDVSLKEVIPEQVYVQASAATEK